MAVLIKWRRDTSANWTSTNSVLHQGEPGFETDTGAFKIGDGTTAWNSLAYATFSHNPFTTMFGDQVSGDPSSAAATKLKVYGKNIAGRMFLKQIGPNGLSTAIQPFLARNKVGSWIPQGNSVTVPGVFGYTAPTAIGTATAVNVATTNMFTRMRRLSYVSATTASSYAGQRVAIAQINLDAGFYKIVRFGISDASIASPANMFIGVSSTVAAPAGGTEPSALLNSIGVGHTSSDTNLKIFYAGSVAQTPIDLGSNFPINTVNTDVYELALFAPPFKDNVVYYEVTRVNTGNVATGVITADTSGSALPAPQLLLTYGYHWRCNLATGLAVSLDIMSDYIETDY